MPTWNQAAVERDSYRDQLTQLAATADALLESLEVMTQLCRIKYGNLDKDVYAEIVKAEAAIAVARGEGVTEKRSNPAELPYTGADLENDFWNIIHRKA